MVRPHHPRCKHWRCYARPVIGGGIVMVVIMIVILPVAVMLGGAVWSALMGWLLVDDAEQRGPTPGQS